MLNPAQRERGAFSSLFQPAYCTHIAERNISSFTQVCLPRLVHFSDWHSSLTSFALLSQRDALFCYSLENKISPQACFANKYGLGCLLFVPLSNSALQIGPASLIKYPIQHVPQLYSVSDTGIQWTRELWLRPGYS